MFPGSETKLLKGLKIGCSGCISAVTNVTHSLARQVFDDFEDRTEEDFDQVISTNLKSVFFDIQNFVRKFDQNNQSSAKILIIGSIFGTVSSDFRNYTDLNRKSPECYGASKAGVIQMTKYFAVHLAKRDISVNCVSPGGIFDPKNPQPPVIRTFMYLILYVI